MKTDNLWTPDPYQEEVINAETGYHLVLAPPGSGKTQILTERIRRAHLRGVAYEDMLCLTFTNRAARGMTERIQTWIADKDVAKVYVGNVHRYCSKFLFDNNLIPAESSVIDEEDSISIIAQYMDEDESKVTTNYSKRKQYSEIIQLCGLMHQIQHQHPQTLRIHEECINNDDVISFRRICEIQHLPFTSQTLIDIYHHTDVYIDMTKSDAYDVGSQKLIDTLLRKMMQAHHYSSYKTENKLLDFEDLLMLTYDALHADDENKLKRYSWIQVDEVQDLNALQLAIIDQLTNKKAFTVMYLGDEQQAIFSFMGAKMDTIELLKKRCEAHIHFLFVNHRSPKYLLDMYNTYAELMLGIDKQLLPTTEEEPDQKGNELQIRSSLNIETEFEEVAQLVNNLHHQGKDDTIAVIVNSNADAELMSNALNHLSLPHFKVSGEDLFSSHEVKLLLAHLNVLNNEHNFIGWSRLLKGLHVFESNAASRTFVKGLIDRSMLPSDLLNYDQSTYVQQFVNIYEQQDIVVFDTETTGLNVFEDDIVQLAAVKMRKGQIVQGSAFVVFMQTDREIPPKLGDIDNPLLEEMSRHILYERATGLQMFMDYVGDSILLGHNVDYDYHILKYNLLRSLPAISLTKCCPIYLDSLKLAKLLVPNLQQYKLKYLLDVLQLEGENSHLADADVNATCHLVSYCYAKAKLAVPSQIEWIRHPRFQKRVEVFRKNYLQSFIASKNQLYNLDIGIRQPVLVNEMMTFYHHLCQEKLIEPNPQLHYIELFLTNDIIDTIKHSALIEQLNTYINEINTLKEADLCNSETLDERVFVTTVHKAKGLEFDTVIVFDAVDGRFPNYFNQNNKRLLEEDKRKFYVAITRAKKRLIVTWSTMKTDYHNRQQQRTLTPFLKPVLRFFEVAD